MALPDPNFVLNKAKTGAVGQIGSLLAFECATAGLILAEGSEVLGREREKEKPQVMGPSGRPLGGGGDESASVLEVVSHS